MPPTIEQLIGKPLVLNGKDDPWLIAGDFHMPFHDEKLIAAMCQVAREQGAKNLLIAGDLFDMSAFSYWKNITKVKFENECQAIETLLKELSGVFPRTNRGDPHGMVVLCGNHEYRFFRLTEDEVSFQRLLYMVDRENLIEGSRWSRCFVEFGGKNGRWRIIHPKQYWKNPGQLARTLAPKFHQHIILAHAHQMSLSFDISGKYYCVDGGLLASPKHIEYHEMNDTTHYEWNPGFVLLKDNKPKLFPRREVV